MKVLFDTNIVLDVVLDRPALAVSSRAALTWGFEHPGRAALAWHSVATLAYFLRKHGAPDNVRPLMGELAARLEIVGGADRELLRAIALPIASPAMMTGLILAVARAAGEVAPLMLVGVVKLAPSLPLDGNFPFLHLERKFMHLGFHIYDVGFQSPNVEAARPLVYATALLLVIIIVVLNLFAIRLRNRMRERMKGLEGV